MYGKTTQTPDWAKSLSAKLVIDAHDVIGEGPIWDAARLRLLWLDVGSGIVHEASQADEGWQETHRLERTHPVCAVLPRSRGGLMLVESTEILQLDEAGRISPFARLDIDAGRMRINEAKCDPQGRLWAGTVALDFTRGTAALYRIDSDGAVAKVLEDVTISNGFDWSPDGSIFYYIDSLTLKLEAFDFDAARGALANRRTVVELKRGEGAFDGMTVDDSGDLWVAVIGSGEIRRYGADGSLRMAVQIPVPGVTSCAFGGADLRDLFITCMSRRMPDVAVEQGFTPDMMDNSGPGAGGLFMCRPGARGKPATLFAG